MLPRHGRLVAAGGDRGRERRGAFRSGRRRAVEDRADRGPRERRPQKRAAPLLPDRPPAHRPPARRDPRGGPRIELVSHPAFSVLHPTGSHPESQRRMTVLQGRFAFVESEPATPDDVRRCHSERLLEQVRWTRGWIDGDTICTETTYSAALLAAGAAIEAVRRGGLALARPPG